jgi:hypothetical protein
MTPRDDRPTKPTPLGPLPEPQDDAAAAALARTLEADAADLNPSDRLHVLRSRTARRPARWPLAAVAVAAVSAAAVLGASVLSSRVDPDDVTPGVASSTSSASEPATSPAPTTDPPQATVVLPVYYLGHDGDRLALFREFHRRTIPDTTTAHLQLALDEATMNQAVDDPELRSPWLPRTDPLRISQVGDVVTVDLPAAEGRAAGRSAAEARLALQKLVWTATAVEQDAALGVRVLVDGKAGRLFGTQPVGDVVHRATPSYSVLGSIWVESPSEGQALSSPVTVTGSACTFEASVAWQLLRGAAVVRSGHTTATSGCPDRGSWSVPLGSLPAGSYTFRAYEPPASGQGPDREDTRAFVVR